MGSMWRRSVAETKKATFTGGNGKSLSASVHSSERISPRHVTTIESGSGDMNDLKKFKHGGIKKPAALAKSVAISRHCCCSAVFWLST